MSDYQLPENSEMWKYFPDVELAQGNVQLADENLEKVFHLLVNAGSGKDKTAVFFIRSLGTPPPKPSREVMKKFEKLMKTMSNNKNAKELRLKLEEMAKYEKEVTDWREFEKRLLAAAKVYAKEKKEKDQYKQKQLENSGRCLRVWIAIKSFFRR